MPSINIREVDTTSSGELTYDDYVVLIPGKSNQTRVGPTLYEDLDTFKRAIVQEGTAPNDTGYQIACKVLGVGLKVLYAVITKQSDLETYDSFWKQFEDKSKYNIRFLTSGGLVSNAIQQHMIKCAAERGDAVALVDITEDNAKSTTSITTEIQTITVNNVAREADTYSGEVVQENPFTYAVSFANWFTVKGETTNYPGSLAYLTCFGYHKPSYADWFAFAGSVRGVLPFESVIPEVAFGDADIAALQKRSLPNNIANYKAVNVVAEIRPYGNIVWGNRTLFPLTSDNPNLKASSFLNIRMLCCDIKKTLYRASKKYTFEPNSDVLWTNFVGAIKPLLEEMKSGQGIRGYKIIKEKTKQKATLKARIRIIPIEAVEDFDLTVEMADSISVTEE